MDLQPGNWVESLKQWTEEKTNSRLLIYYLVIFQLFNWKITSTLWFEDTDILKIPKVEYVTNNLLMSDVWYWNVVWHFATPFLIALSLILVLPLFTRFALHFRLNQHFNAKKDFDEKEAQYEVDKTEALKKIRGEKVKQFEVKKDINANTSDQEKWSEEARGVSIETLLNLKRELENLIYENRGSLDIFYRATNKKFNSAALGTADLLGLIKFNDARDTVSLTEKGKYIFSKLIK